MGFCAKGPYDVVILPGGLGGSKILAESSDVDKLLKEQELSDRMVAAIFASPTALKVHKISLGKSFTLRFACLGASVFFFLPEGLFSTIL